MITLLPNKVNSTRQIELFCLEKYSCAIFRAKTCHACHVLISVAQRV